MMKRRSFLSYFSLGWLTSCFPIILAVCAPTKSTAQTITNKERSNIGNKDNTISDNTKTDADFTVIGTVADLQKNGYLQTKEAAVLRNPL